jgi:hypothetical protein
VTLDDNVNRFRIASRELFTSYFRSADEEAKLGWTLERRFVVVQALLFDEVVTEPASLSAVPYRNLQPKILVQLRLGALDAQS